LLTYLDYFSKNMVFSYTANTLFLGLFINLAKR
jgi:hypothetical protein